MGESANQGVDTMESRAAGEGPVASIIMPMRNPGRYLGAAIFSILGQEFYDLELIIIDDGSTDGSREYVAGLSDTRIRLLAGPCSGISACLNVGLAAAIGRYVMRCDADDLYPAGRIGMHVAWLERHADYIAVAGTFSMIDTDGVRVASPVSEFDRELMDAAPRMLEHRLWTHLCAFAMRRTAIARLGGFREYFETSEDADFLLRVAGAGNIGFLPHEAYLYRIHGESITHTQKSVRRQFFERVAHEMSQDRQATGSDALMRGDPPQPPSAYGVLEYSMSARQHLSQLHIGEAWKAFNIGDRAGAWRMARRAVRAHPGNPGAWKVLVLIAIRRARSLKRCPAPGERR